MPNWRFWERAEDDAPPAPPPVPEGRRLPPPRNARPAGNPANAEALAKLRTRRDQLAYDLERAESAHDPENQWTERVALLEESLATIAADLDALAELKALPQLPLPPMPVTGLSATREEPSRVEFAIGGEAFLFEEERDWDERGGPRVRGELKRRTGDATRLAPPGIPEDRRATLAQHLVDRVFAFAAAMRDRAIEGKPMPEAVTLGDLAMPCVVCGNWREWGGACETCAQRAYRKQRLNSEALRLQKERENEVEDRHKWAERLPIARRRMADLEQQIADLLG